MDTLTAFAIGQANKHKELMVFDWIKAAEILKERNTLNAYAGLSGDWEWTGGEILRDGKIPDDTYTYLVSTWAKPELVIDGEVIECYKMQSETNGWDEDTFWPDEAKKIYFG